jgi:hypothetical protein
MLAYWISGLGHRLEFAFTQLGESRLSSKRWENRSSHGGEEDGYAILVGCDGVTTHKKKNFFRNVFFFEE